MIKWIKSLWASDASEDQTKTNQISLTELAKQLRRVDDEDGQDRALGALTELGNEEAQKVLFEALQDSSLSKLSGRIVYHLSQFKITLARPALLKCLEDTDPFIRGEAAQVIGNMKEKDPVLTKALVNLLKKITGTTLESLSPGLNPGLYTGETALKMLNNSTSQGRFALYNIIEALGKLRERTAVDSLNTIIKCGNSLHPDVLYYAKQALAAIKTEDDLTEKSFCANFSKENEIFVDNNTADAALVLASKKGDLEVVKILIEKGVDVNAKNLADYGYTALLLALNNEHTEIAKIFIENGADINEANNEFSNTALIVATALANTEIVRILIEKGADINKTKTNGANALHIASDRGYTEIARMLIEGGIDINAKVEDGRTALNIALEQGHTDIVELLNKISVQNLVNVYNLKTDDEKKIIADAKAGKSAGAKFDALIEELKQILKKEIRNGICSYDEKLESNLEYESRDGDGKGPWVHRRVRIIGKELCKAGGIGAMQAAFYRCGESDELNRAWDCVGDGKDIWLI